MLLVLVVVVVVPRLSDRYLALRNRGVLAGGTLVFAVEALFVNVARPFGVRTPPILDHLGFAALLFSFGYVALQLAFTNERRLLAIENELEIARKMQLQILPAGAPQVGQLRMSAAYQPMTAVAGDFYDFVAIDEMRVGILVADVAGHGVSAALIASMIKVAMQSVVSVAGDPGAVLGGLNRILSGQLRGQLVSAAYLWLDTENRTARYSAAGHPPLLRWSRAHLEGIESNGLLFGMLDECEYPVRTMEIEPGQRFLLYTDGVTESENGRGEFFGDARLEEVVRGNQGRSPSECSDAILDAIRRWRPPSVPQQDDITLVVVAKPRGVRRRRARTRSSTPSAAGVRPPYSAGRHHARRRRRGVSSSRSAHTLRRVVQPTAILASRKNSSGIGRRSRHVIAIGRLPS